MMGEGAVEETDALRGEGEGRESSLLRNRRFLCLWIASLCSGLSLSVYLTTESWYVVRGLGMDWALGVVLMATTIPRVLLMMWGGVAADRFSRARIMLLSDGSRCLLVAGMVLLLWSGGLSLSSLLLFAVLFGVSDAFFWPASGSIVPTLVNRHQLLRANSLMETTSQTAMILGPAVAGAAMTFGSFPASFGIAAAALLLACAALCGIGGGWKGQGTEGKRPSSPLRELKEGFRYVWSNRWMKTLMPISLFINLLLTGPVTAGLPVMVDRHLDGDALDLSWLQSSFAVGMAGGALLVGWMNIRRRRMVVNIALILVLGMAVALFSRVTSVAQGVGILSAGGIVLAFSNTLGRTLFQELVDADKLGRITSLSATASMGLIPLSHGLVALALSAGLPITDILLGSGMAIAVYMAVVLWKVKIIQEID